MQMQQLQQSSLQLQQQQQSAAAMSLLGSAAGGSAFDPFASLTAFSGGLLSMGTSGRQHSLQMMGQKLPPAVIQEQDSLRRDEAVRAAMKHLGAGGSSLLLGMDKVVEIKEGMSIEEIFELLREPDEDVLDKAATRRAVSA